MTIFNSIIEVLLVTNKSGKAKKTGNDFSIDSAHCVLRDETGKAGAVGVLMVPKALGEVLKPGVTGMYTATFALQAGEFGENQGRIMAVLTGLTALSPEMVKRLQSNAAAPRPALPAGA